MFFAAELAAIEHFASHQVVIFLKHFKIDQPVVDGDFVANVHGINQFLIVNTNRRFFDTHSIADSD